MKEKEHFKTLLSKYLPRDTSTIFLAALLGILVSAYNEVFFLIKIGLEINDQIISVIKLVTLTVGFIVVMIIYRISINSKENNNV